MLIKSAEMIGWALGGIEREIMSTRERLVALTAQANSLRARLPRGARVDVAGTSDAAHGAPGNGRRRRRRRMSPEARKRISDMMKKRWAERRKKQ